MWDLTKNSKGTCAHSRLKDCKTKLMVTKGERLGEGMSWEFRTGIYTLLYIKSVGNKDPQYSTRKSNQHSVMAQMGKESVKE